MDLITAIIYLVILIPSAILHEIAHGVVAERFGDDTARRMGRITLNPLAHIDPYFSILVPLGMILFQSPVIFGAAKPVPVNYYNLRNFRWGVFWVSIAGILTNLFIAFAFALPLHFSGTSGIAATICISVVRINVILAVINLIPIPPIDGSKVLAALLGSRAIYWIMSIEMRGLFGILPFLILVYLLFFTSGFYSILIPIANFLFRIFGVPGI